MKKSLLKICFLSFWVFLSFSQANPEGNKKEGGNVNKLNKPNSQTAITYLDINNISSLFYNNGLSDISQSGNPGFVYPKGSGKTAVFTSGLLWGAKVAGFADPRVGGTAYRTGLVPGKVLPNGTADDPVLDKYRIYRVRRDVYPGGPVVDLSADAINEGTDATSLRASYETDWSQWPGEIMGAPFEDKNNDGIYQPETDIPGVPGADQTIWYVTNDLNSSQTTYLYNSNPLGIECQVTIWAYKQLGALGNMFFKKYKLINITDRTASPITFNDMYLSYWMDADVGDAGDDFVGVDTTIGLQYSYNARTTDNRYKPYPPPAVGISFLNNKMTAAYYFANGDPNIGDPPQGTNAPADGYRQFYNFFQGKYGLSSAPFIDIVTGNPATYALNGDPINKSGWIDGLQLPAGDRRQGIATGPFNLAPGETKELILAEIAAIGKDNINAIKVLKFYHSQAKELYSNSFAFVKNPTPHAPQILVNDDGEGIKLSWDKISETGYNVELFNQSGFQFEGYNLYQLYSPLATKANAKLIATFDKIDGIYGLTGIIMDPATGLPMQGIEQFGTDSGIKYSLDINTDMLNYSSLIKGKEYNYAVSSYAYNTDLNATITNLESELIPVSIKYHYNQPGFNYLDTLATVHTTGSADGSLAVTVVNPVATLGHIYEVFFTERQEIRNANGDWIAGSKVVRKFNPNHPDTLSGTIIDAAAVYGPSVGGIEVHFKLNLVSVDYDYADGLTITFHAGTTIISAPKFTAGNGTISPVISGNTVIFGETSHRYTGNGPFSGGEEFVVQVTSLTLPATIDWTVYDDGYGGGPVDASGTTTLSSLGTLQRTAKYWNLKDATSNLLKLENQGSFVDKNDQTGSTTINYFPKRDDISINEPIAVVDGFQIGIDGSYDAPIVFNTDNTKLNAGSTSTLVLGGTSASSTRIVINNYTIYGLPTSWAKDDWGYGTSEVAQLQQDYELRFTGIWDTVVVGGQTIIKIKDGTGSLATISQGLDANSLKNHPLNPNPGSGAAFLVRIPFEVWNKDTKKQVNLMFRDREQAATANPFFAWNKNSRMYSIIVNSDYNLSTPITGALRDSATWTVVFYGTNYHVGDTLTLAYENPFVFGTDKYTFSTDKPVGIDDINNLIPNNYCLYQNYPNPFNPTTIIKYDIPQGCLVTIKVFDILGRLVETLVNEEKSVGKYSATFKAKNLASGIYFYTLKAGNFIQTMKMLVLK